MKKFELIPEQHINWHGHILYRIKACTNFATVYGDIIHAGDIGGYVEREGNLSQIGSAWIAKDAKVYDNAVVHGDALISDNTMIRENAEVYDKAYIYGNAEIYGNAKVYGHAKVYNYATVGGNAKVFGRASAFARADICDFAQVYERAEVCDSVMIFSDAKIYGSARIKGEAIVADNADISSQEHIFCASPIGEGNEPLTAYRTKVCELSIRYKFLSYSCSEFENEIKRWDDKHRNIAIAVLNAAKLHIDLTPIKPKNKPCPLCSGSAVIDSSGDCVVCTICGASATLKSWNKRV